MGTFLFITCLSAMFLLNQTGWAIDHISNWTIREWNAPQDLPNEVVRDVIMTRDGSVWIATWGGGIVKTDGLHKEVFDIEDGLISNDVRDLEEDVYGRLWIGTNTGISCYYRDKFYNFSSKTIPVIPDNDSVFSIGSLQNGEVWFGDSLGYLYAWIPPERPEDVENGRWQVIHRFNELGSIIRKIEQSSDQCVYIAADKVGLVKFEKPLFHGDYRWNFYTKEVEKFRDCKSFVITENDHVFLVGNVSVFEFIGGVIKNNYDNLYEIKSINKSFGKLFIGTEQGMYILENSQLTFCPLTNDNRKLHIECISSLRDGSLWIGTRSGAFHFSEPTWIKQDLSENDTLPIAESLAGNGSNTLYVLDYDGYLWSYKENEWVDLYQFPLNVLDNPTVALSADTSRVIVYISHEIYEFDPSLLKIVNRLQTLGYLHLGGKNQISLPNEKDVWLASNNGLLKWDKNLLVPALEHLPHEDMEVYSVLQTSSNEYWIGGKGWIEHWKDGQGEHINLPPSFLDEDSAILDSIQTQDGDLWFSQLGKGILRDSENQWYQETMKTGLFSNYIWALFQASDGTIWAGDRINGVMSYKDGRWIRYGYGDGVPVGGVVSIEEDEFGEIWIGIEKQGIFKFRPDHSAPKVEIVSAPKQLVPDAQGIFSFRGYDA